MTQKLILPMNRVNVNAGYKMAAYTKSWGFAHYGIDLGNPDRQRTIYSPGDGTVIAAGMDGDTPSQRMGNALVLVFPDVARNDGKTSSLACRMFHLDSLAVKAGQAVFDGWDGKGVSSGWIGQNDLDLPRLPEESSGPDYQALYEAEAKKVQTLREGIQSIVQKMQGLVG